MSGGRRPYLLALAAVAAVVAGALVVVLTIVREPAGADQRRAHSDAQARGEVSQGRGEAADGQDRALVRAGYVPYWDQERAFDVVWEQAELLNEVSPVWYSLEPTGEIVLADDEHTTVDRDAVERLRERGISVIPTVTNLRNGDWNPEVVQKMLHDPQRRRRHVEALTQLARTEGYDGIDIDYEDLAAADRDVYTDFLTELADALHAEDKVLTTAVHPKTSDAGDDERNEAQDYRAIGAVADQVRVMTYDYSWDMSPPGPVAPRSWVDEVIAWTVTQIPPAKVVLGIDLLGYDWVDGLGSTIDYGEAMATARKYDVPVRRSDDGTPWLAYRDWYGRAHEAWFEDATSVSAKLELVNEYDLAGVFYWRLGGEDPAVWDLGTQPPGSQ